MDASKNPKVVGWAALGLLLMGCVSLFLVHVGDFDADTVELAAGTGVLFALGCSGAAVAGIQRLEARVQKLEAGQK